MQGFGYLHTFPLVSWYGDHSNAVALTDLRWREQWNGGHKRVACARRAIAIYLQCGVNWINSGLSFYGYKLRCQYTNTFWLIFRQLYRTRFSRRLYLQYFLH